MQMTGSFGARRTARVAVIAALAGAAGASAKPRRPPPPTKAQLAAIRLARSWLAALPNGVDAIAPLTAKPFFAVIYDDAGTPCPPASDAACLRTKLAPEGKPHIWGNTLGGPLLAERARLHDASTIVVELDGGCDGTESQTLVVTKRGKVLAVLAQTIACNE
jgi:hypothetical protein